MSSDAEDKLDFCRQALGEIGTRSTITSLDPPDGTPEGFYCNLFFNGTRDQVLRAAHWGFAARTDPMVLWKARPGTPENPTIPPGYSWSDRDPAPGYLYSYVYHGTDRTDVVQIRRVREQAPPISSDANNLPFYEGAVTFEGRRDEFAPFEVATDRYDRSGTFLGYTSAVSEVTITSGGTGYKAGDYISAVASPSVARTGQPAQFIVGQIGLNNEVLNVVIPDGGTFSPYVPGRLTITTLALTQQSTTGIGTGFACTVTISDRPAIAQVILTNARNALFDFTTNDLLVAYYDPLFGDAFMLALEGKLALALLGDRALYQAKLQEANNSIINARVRDGNEGLTTYDHVPDWLQVRGVSSMASGGEWFNPPYGPLFAV